MEIGFNVNYISEAVGALDNDEIEFCLNDRTAVVYCAFRETPSICMCHADAL